MCFAGCRLLSRQRGEQSHAKSPAQSPSVSGQTVNSEEEGRGEICTCYTTIAMSYTREEEEDWSYRSKSLLVAPKSEVPIWQTKKVWELEVRTKFVYCISVLNGDWNNESLCFPSPLPAFFGILRKGKLWAGQTFREFPSVRPSLPGRLFSLLVSLTYWMIQTSTARRPLHPSHRTGPSLNVWDHMPPATFSCPFLCSQPLAAFLHLLPSSLPALSPDIAIF